MRLTGRMDRGASQVGSIWFRAYASLSAPGRKSIPRGLRTGPASLACNPGRRLACQPHFDQEISEAIGVYQVRSIPCAADSGDAGAGAECAVSQWRYGPCASSDADAGCLRTCLRSTIGDVGSPAPIAPVGVGDDRQSTPAAHGHARDCDDRSGAVVGDDSHGPSMVRGAGSWKTCTGSMLPSPIKHRSLYCG